MPNPTTPDGATKRKGAEPRTEIVPARLTVAAKQRIAAEAAGLGISTSEHVANILERHLATTSPKTS